MSVGFLATDPCGRLLAGMLGPNPTGVTDVCLLLVLCIVRYRYLRQADPSSIGDLSSVCVCVCVGVIEEPHRRGPGSLGLSSCRITTLTFYIFHKL